MVRICKHLLRLKVHLNASSRFVMIHEKDQHLSVSLNKVKTDNFDFTITFKATIMETSAEGAPNFDHSKSFTRLAKEVFETSTSRFS